MIALLRLSLERARILGVCPRPANDRLGLVPEPSWIHLCTTVDMDATRDPKNAANHRISDSPESESSACAGWEVMCPDGLSRHLPYHNRGDAESHARFASDPKWFAKRGCRLAPKPGRRERLAPPCPGGEHHALPILVQHATARRGEA